MSPEFIGLKIDGLQLNDKAPAEASDSLEIIAADMADHLTGNLQSQVDFQTNRLRALS